MLPGAAEHPPAASASATTGAQVWVPCGRAQHPDRCRTILGSSCAPPVTLGDPRAGGGSLGIPPVCSPAGREALPLLARRDQISLLAFLQCLRHFNPPPHTLPTTSPSCRGGMEGTTRAPSPWDPPFGDAESWPLSGVWGPNCTPCKRGTDAGGMRTGKQQVGVPLVLGEFPAAGSEVLGGFALPAIEAALPGMNN